MKSLKEFEICKKLHGFIKFEGEIEDVDIVVKEINYNATGYIRAVNTNLKTISFLKIVEDAGHFHSKLFSLFGASQITITR